MFIFIYHEFVIAVLSFVVLYMVMLLFYGVCSSASVSSGLCATFVRGGGCCVMSDPNSPAFFAGRFFSKEVSGIVSMYFHNSLAFAGLDVDFLWQLLFRLVLLRAARLYLYSVYSRDACALARLPNRVTSTPVSVVSITMRTIA